MIGIAALILTATAFGGLHETAVEEWVPTSLRDACLEADFLGHVTVLGDESVPGESHVELILRVEETFLGDPRGDHISMVYRGRVFTSRYTPELRVGESYVLGMKWESENAGIGNYYGFWVDPNPAAFRAAGIRWKSLPPLDSESRLEAEFEWLLSLLADPDLYEEALFELLPQQYTQVHPDFGPGPFRKFFHTVPEDTFSEMSEFLSPAAEYRGGKAWHFWYLVDAPAACDWLRKQPTREVEGLWDGFRVFPNAYAFWGVVARALPAEDGEELSSLAYQLKLAFRPREGEELGDDAKLAAIAKLQEFVNRLEAPPALRDQERIEREASVDESSSESRGG